MSDYRRWYQIQSDNYMKSLEEIKKLEEENEILKDTLSELSDEQLEVVIGGMSEGKYKKYIVDLINDYNQSVLK
jgi:hypothetical protein